jgi:DNA repair protein RadC
MHIKQMPFYTRPWYKMKTKGPSSLDEAELLAVIFGKGNYQDNAINLANLLLKKYNLHNLSEISFNEINSVLKEDVKTLQIMALSEICKRYSILKKKGFTKVIEKAEDVYNIFVDELKDKKKEYFYALLLDTKNKIIKKELISIGTLNSSLVHPREVFKPAIKESANAIILVHNHPSGDVEISSEDLFVTEKLKRVGEEIGIKVLDHIIIGTEKYKSIL